VEAIEDWKAVWRDWPKTGPPIVGHSDGGVGEIRLQPTEHGIECTLVQPEVESAEFHDPCDPQMTRDRRAGNFGLAQIERVARLAVGSNGETIAFPRRKWDVATQQACQL
jgi:hypothetical protein